MSLKIVSYYIPYILSKRLTEIQTLVLYPRLSLSKVTSFDNGFSSWEPLIV